MVVPLPQPLGLVCTGGSYVLLTLFCFVSKANGMELTDGLEWISWRNCCTCIHRNVHYSSSNMFRSASVFMGDTGTLALGGALAAMAASTRMFFPLLISSGVIVLEALSVLLQDGLNWKIIKVIELSDGSLDLPV
ncbi:putative phospho-N-acetylmuramoyl-pentapeptide-transferase [Helianthus annuus]|nr:putative phospho-N-acetylmuramoyl-pentapeptide-transferase [Helianthus annuus]